MASAKQIEANQSNAKKSTGPRTSAGKARVSLNALKHGLLARQVVLPNEDKSEFARFSQSLAQELKPVGELEELFVSLIIASAWRLRRLMRVEKGLFIEYVYQRSNASVSDNAPKRPLILNVHFDRHGKPVSVEDGEYEEFVEVEEPLSEEATALIEEAEARATEVEELAKRADVIRVADDVQVGAAFIDDGRSVDAFSRLSRYEAHIQRSMFKAIDELQRLQAARHETHNALAPLDHL